MLSAGQRAHVAAVLTPNQLWREHPFIGDLAQAGVPFSPIVAGARSYLTEFKLLASLVNRIQPAVVHTHGYRADVIGGQAARRCGVPTVSTVHGFTGGSRRNRLNERLQLLALRYADQVIAVSRPLVARLVRAGVPTEKIHYVQNGFAPSCMLSREAARSKLGIAADALVAAWVGRLSREKGPDVALRALASSDQPWRLAFIGSGPEEGELRRLAVRLGIDDRIDWCGAVPNAGSVLPAFDALILSSRTEGTPIILLEAMHAGLPIVATLVGGVPDVVDASQAILVPPDEPAMIAQSLDKIATRPTEAQQRAMRAADRVADKFQPAAWLKRVSAVYEKALA
jgi:glycosyltransferase involved in cell wall biosynthesis